MDRLIRRGGAFSAVFAASDVVALGRNRRGARPPDSVPEQLAIVGFDDIPLAAYFDPPLTTVHLPAHAWVSAWAGADRPDRRPAGAGPNRPRDPACRARLGAGPARRGGRRASAGEAASGPCRPGVTGPALVPAGKEHARDPGKIARDPHRDGSGRLVLVAGACSSSATSAPTAQRPQQPRPASAAARGVRIARRASAAPAPRRTSASAVAAAQAYAATLGKPGGSVSVLAVWGGPELASFLPW